jgi:hypothetical protein
MTSTERPKPDCLIIGAAKAGTTSLFNVLAGHPEVYAARVKETRFFSHDDRFRKGLDWYRAEYFSRAPERAVRLEATPAYLTWSDKVAPRIRRSYPEGGVRLVVVLRDPVTRAYSHYWHRVRLGHEPLSFAGALAREDSRLRAHWDELERTGNGKYGYVRAGCYATRLRPFVEQFGRDRLFSLLQEDLRPDRFEDTLSRLLAFLEIDDTVPLPPARLNTPTRARHAGLARAYWRLKKTSARGFYTMLVPEPVRRRILDVLFPAADYRPLDADIERRLRVQFRDEVIACQELIGRDLSQWLPS